MDNEKKLHIEIAVGAFIFNPEGKIFLMRTPKWHNKYGPPGGHIELGETAEQAVIRETKEETNLDVFDVKYLMMQEGIFSKEFYKKKHFIFLGHSCKTKDTTNVILDEKEGTEHVWADIDEALKLDLVPYTRDVIIEYKKKYLS